METLSTKSITLQKLHRLALDNGIAFVTYRLPKASGPVTLLQWESAPLRIHDIKDLKGQSGFVFAPFDHKSVIPIRIIKPDLVVEGDTFSEPRNDDSTLNVVNPSSDSQNFSLAYTSNYVADKQEFMHQVEKVKSIISGHTISKLVLSRTQREDKPANFDSTSFFDALDKAYPEAFVFAIYIPDTGLWFGATPEPLLLIQDNRATTVSLAGTRKVDFKGSKQPWGEKELDEQLIVTEYIERLLQKRNIRNIEKKGPYTFGAGSLEHLKTTFSFPATELGEQTTEFLEELHPTPSVCGLPKSASMQLIAGIEKHRREYYSGFLGPMNMKGEWNIYVNLRSMKAVGQKLEYYLGAGITMGSEAEKEWEETLNKMNTMKSVVESLKDH